MISNSSGATALIYEVAWARMLTQIFGNTTHAIATVLTAFMAGLALGSYLVGRRVERVRNPLLLYAMLEAQVPKPDLVIFLQADTERFTQDQTSSRGPRFGHERLASAKRFKARS